MSDCGKLLIIYIISFWLQGTRGDAGDPGPQGEMGTIGPKVKNSAKFVNES